MIFTMMLREQKQITFSIIFWGIKSVPYVAVLWYKSQSELRVFTGVLKVSPPFIASGVASGSIQI